MLAGHFQKAVCPCNAVLHEDVVRLEIQGVTHQQKMIANVTEQWKAGAEPSATFKAVKGSHPDSL